MRFITALIWLTIVIIPTIGFLFALGHINMPMIGQGNPIANISYYILDQDPNSPIGQNDELRYLFAKKFIEVLKLNNSSIDSEEVFIKVKKYVQNNSSDNPRYRWIKDVGHNEGVFVFSAKN